MKRPEDDKEFMEVVGHLISHPRFQKLDGIVQHHHSTRLEHSVNVSYTSYKIFYYDWRVTKFNKSHAWVHPRIAVRNARKLVNLNKKEEDIILKHMWGATIAPPKYKESYIVTMVDKYWAVKEAATPLRNRIKNRKFLRRKTLQSHHQ